MKPPAATAFAERAALYCKKAAEAARPWYDVEGNWIAPSIPPETRERYWLALALYAVDDNSVADAVIRGGDTSTNDNGVPTTFNIFHTNTAAALLLKHGGQMAGDIRLRLEGIVRDGFSLDLGNSRPDYQFHGYNDNMPSEAALGLILGGELLGDPEPVEHGLWDLRQMRALLIRRGINSEWNSPTYSPITLHAMAEIAAHARNPEARDLARQIEERLWLDFAGRFHPEIGALAGPYSRAYSIDALAHLSIAASLFWFVLGDAARPSPMELFNPRSGLVLHHEGDLPFNIAQMCILATAEYHLPARAAELFARKTYPSRAVAMAEQGDAGPDHPAGPIRIETFLEPDFAVGTSSIPFLGGEQTGGYCVLYKRAPDVRSFRDVGVVYNKFIIDDTVPGTIVAPADKAGRPYANSGEHYLWSYSSFVTLQSDASVLQVSCPQVKLGGLEDGVPPRPVTRLNEMIFFPSHFGGGDEIRVGNRALDSWSGEASHGEWIGCRRGRLLIAIRPLAYAPELGPVRITLERIHSYEVLRVTFYDGAARTFTRSDLRKVFAGFVAEHAGVGEYPSLAAFMEDVSRASFNDHFCTTRRVRYRRPESKARKALEMEVSWSPGSAAPRFAAINGRAPSLDARVQIDGLKESDFPFLREPWTSVPPYFPWEKINVPCCKMVGFIADRE